MQGAAPKLACTGVFYRHPYTGATTGRIASSIDTLEAIGGYDEELGPMGGQEKDLMHRLTKYGRTTRVEGTMVGTTLTMFFDMGRAGVAGKRLVGDEPRKP